MATLVLTNTPPDSPLVRVAGSGESDGAEFDLLVEAPSGRRIGLEIKRQTHRV